MRRRLLISRPFSKNANGVLSGLVSVTGINSALVSGGSFVTPSGILSSSAIGSASVGIGISTTLSSLLSSSAIGSVSVFVPEPWDISTASFVQSFSVASQESLALGLFFRADGTRMYVVGFSGDDVNEYSLSSAWDVSTASYTRNFSVSSQSLDPAGIYFKDDGTKMYVSSTADSEINEYNLSTAWNVSTASYSQNFSVSAQDSFPTGVFFKPDGTKMYVVGNDNRFINEYNLSSAWNISSASYNQNFSVSTQEAGPWSVFFKPDGTKMYVLGDSGDDVNQYDLGTAWDVSTASYVQNFSVASQDTNPSGLSFKPDGTKMYVVGYSSDRVNEYDLG